MKNHNYSHYVSLGVDCKTRYQIDKVFSGRSFQYEPTKGVFDWLWGAGMNGVVDMIDNNMEIMASNLVVKMIHGIPQVFDNRTGFYFQHDFKFSQEAALSLSLAHTEMNDQLNNFHDKYNHLAKKSKSYFVKSHTVCFVYSGALDRNLVERFHSSIQSTFGSVNFNKPNLLYVVPSNVVVDPNEFDSYNDCIFVRTVDDSAVKGTPNEWQGDDESWNKVFEGFALV